MHVFSVFESALYGSAGGRASMEIKTYRWRPFLICTAICLWLWLYVYPRVPDTDVGWQGVENCVIVLGLLFLLPGITCIFHGLSFWFNENGVLIKRFARERCFIPWSEFVLVGSVEIAPEVDMVFLSTRGKEETMEHANYRFAGYHDTDIIRIRSSINAIAWRKGFTLQKARNRPLLCLKELKRIDALRLISKIYCINEKYARKHNVKPIERLCSTEITYYPLD